MTEQMAIKTAGDNIFSFLMTVPANLATGVRNISISIADAQSRTATTNISLTVFGAPDPNEHLVLGQSVKRGTRC
jgi:hypothetical protein